jgi:FkbM family methyltransferase
MLNALQAMLAKLPATMSVLDVVLPRVTRELQDELVYWVDGGAGVGTSSTGYADILERELLPQHVAAAKVVLYEPLPENVAVLQHRLGHDSRYLIRDVAVAGQTGTATFTVPSRITATGAGSWAEGTSYSGSLRSSWAGAESIVVQTVRLDEEALPRFDFVKLDLQGGELDALQGMGARLLDVKLLYVETQLLHEKGALKFLNEHGFLLLFDRLQFGFQAGLTYIPVELLRACGISIDRMHLPQSSGMPLICWGHFDPGTDVLDPQTFFLKTEISKKLIDAGINYLQTDALAINVKWLPRIAPCLLP